MPTVISHQHFLGLFGTNIKCYKHCIAHLNNFPKTYLFVFQKVAIVETWATQVHDNKICYLR